MRANEREVLDLLIASDGPQATRDLLPRCRIISDATDLSRAIYNLRRMLLVEEADRVSAPGSKALVKRYRATALAHTLTAQEAATQEHAKDQDQLPGAMDERPDEERNASAAAWDAGAEWVRPPEVEGPAADYAGCPADDLLEALSTELPSDRPRLTVTRIAIHRNSESPIYGAGVTWVELADEGGGPYLVISQPSEATAGRIALDHNELPLLIEAARRLGIACAADTAAVALP